jgi:excisionase family DNA binding protein
LNDVESDCFRIVRGTLGTKGIAAFHGALNVHGYSRNFILLGRLPVAQINGVRLTLWGNWAPRYYRSSETVIMHSIREQRCIRIGIDNVVPASIADQIERMPHAMTVRELTAILQVSDQTIYRMIADQTIPFFLVRGSYRFDPKRIAEWLRRRS